MDRTKQLTISSSLQLQVWAKADKQVSAADLKIFYPPDLVKIADDEWQVDHSIVIATWSGKLSGVRNSEFIVKSIRFRPVASGKVNIEFDFSKESLLDCNLFDLEGKDILEGVEDGVYYIK